MTKRAADKILDGLYEALEITVIAKQHDPWAFENMRDPGTRERRELALRQAIDEMSDRLDQI